MQVALILYTCPFCNFEVTEYQYPFFIPSTHSNIRRSLLSTVWPTTIYTPLKMLEICCFSDHMLQAYWLDVGRIAHVVLGIAIMCRFVAFLGYMAVCSKLRDA